jgi:hypothetical protein
MGIEGRAEALVERMSVEATMQQILEHRASGIYFEAGLAQFLAEKGLFPMYGMPTRVRNLYLGLRAAGRKKLDWDAVDRDLDVAIFEFSPGQVLTRDKQKHKAIGFTGSLMRPAIRGTFAPPVVPDRMWWDSSHHVSACPRLPRTHGPRRAAGREFPMRRLRGGSPSRGCPALLRAVRVPNVVPAGRRQRRSRGRSGPSGGSRGDPRSPDRGGPRHQPFHPCRIGSIHPPHERRTAGRRGRGPGGLCGPHGPSAASLHAPRHRRREPSSA